MASLPVKCRGCSKVFGVPADTPVLSIVKCPSCDIRNKVEPPSAFNLPLPTPAATKPQQGLPVRCRGCSGLFQTPRNTAPLSIVTCPTCNVRNKVQPSFDTDAPLSSSFSSSSSATPAGGRSSVPAVGGPADLRHSITFLEEAVEVLDVICRDCGAAFQAEQGQHSVVHCPACGVRNKVETAVAPAPAPTAAVSANADAAAAAAAAGTAGANPTVDNASTGAAHQRQQQQQGGEEEGQKCHIEVGCQPMQSPLNSPIFPPPAAPLVNLSISSILSISAISAKLADFFKPAFRVQGFLFKQSVRSILGVHRFQKRYFVLEDNGKPSERQRPACVSRERLREREVAVVVAVVAVVASKLLFPSASSCTLF